MTYNNKRYFILPYPNIHSSIWDVIVETPETLRTNLQGNFCIIKLYVGDNADHPILNGFPEYTHEEILAEINGNPEWENDEI